MKSGKTSHRDVANLVLVVVLTISVALFAIAVNCTGTILDFLTLYAKIGGFHLYANLILLYLTGLLWLIYRGWIRALRRQAELEDIILSIHPDVLLVTDPEDRIAVINSMMSKGYSMTENQRNNINKAIDEARELIAANKTDEANRLLKKTINTLELIAETDRFNKSE